MRSLIAVFLVLFIVPGIVLSQWCTVEGTVTDQFGYGIPNVEVKYINEHWGDEWIDTTDGSGNYSIGITSSVENIGEAGYPKEFTLFQNYPNPFNPGTVIPFDINVPGEVSLNIYNILGERVKNLHSGYLQPGSYRTNWDGTNENGEGVSAGIYIYQLRTKNSSISKKMILLDGHIGISNNYSGNSLFGQNGESPPDNIISDKGANRLTDQYNIYRVYISGQYIEPYTQSNITLPGGNITLNYSNIYNKLISHDFTSNSTLYTQYSPYYLQGTVDVDEGITLVIEPNVDIWTLSGSKLRIFGTLHADATSYGTRIFIKPENTSSFPPDTTTWTGIEFKQEASSSSTITYCDISYATTGIKFHDGPYSMTITDSWISYCATGVDIDECDLTLEYCQISWCHTRGVLLYASATLNTEYSEVLNCYNGFQIYTSGSSNAEIHFCNIEDHDHFHLQNDPGDYINVQNNWWGEPNYSNWGDIIAYPEWANYNPWLTSPPPSGPRP